MRLRFRRNAAFAALLCLVACSSKADKGKSTEDQTKEKISPATLADLEPVDDRQPSSMTVTLTEGDPDAASSGGLTLAETTALTQAQTNSVLARLTDLVVEADDKKDFAKRADSQPPPKTGETIKTAFPPAADRARPTSVDVADTALRVVRQQPEGETPIAPHLSISFNKPMVTIASHADTIAENVPVTITPKPAGQWRWVGAKTLLFEPEGGRFPMATEYAVTVPQGTKASTGETLAESTSWTFGTPPPVVQQSWPGGGTYGLDQLMFVSFDQKIDRQKVLQSMKLRTGGVFGSAKLMLAEPEKINANDTMRALVENAEEDRWIAVRAVEDLPYDSNITLTIEKGTPSAEGPRTTTSDYSTSFRTYGPFKVTEARCGWGDCNPHAPFTFNFSNTIAPEDFSDALITVEPSFPTMSVSMSGAYLSISGLKPGRRKYKVTIDRELTDEFGQKLTDKNTFSFDVGPATPQLFSTSDVMNVLDPSSKPSYTISTVNYAELELTAYEVEPRDWADYLAWLHDYRYYGKKEVQPPGKKRATQKIAIDARPDDIVQTEISLSKLLGESEKGNLVLFLTPTKVTKGSDMPEYPPEIRTWVQATEIGIDAFIDQTEFIVWANTLDDGEPMQNVSVEVLSTGQRATTDGTGIARIDLVPWESKFENRANILLAKAGNDQAFLPESMWGSNQNTSWYRQERGDDLSWFVFDDRGMYKPKEKVTFKGWIRAIENREHGMVKLATGVRNVTYTVFGPQGNEITKGSTKTTELGGFSADFDIPETPNLGYARIELRSDGGGYYTHGFQIQEFRTPEFEVKANAGEGPYFATESAVATVEANYYAGGGLPNAEVNWHVTASQTSFVPPNQSDYTFGSWTPWWASSSSAHGGSESWSFQSKTDPTGAHYLKMSFGTIEPPRPMSVRAQATVMDVNRQAWTSTANLIVHPSEHYVGMKTDRYFVREGEPMDLAVVVSDVAGNLLPDRPVKVRAARVQWKWRNYSYEEEEVDPQLCELTTTDAPGKCTFDTKVGGTYRIVATTVDDHGRRNFSEMTRWVSGGKQPVARRVEQEQITIIPDKDEYQPGETAELLVQSPIVPAEGFYTLRRNGMIEEKRFTMSEPTMTLTVPIKHTHLPNLYVQVDAVGSQPRLGSDGNADETLPRRPAYASGAINLKIPPHTRDLAVEVKPADARVEPAAKTSVDVIVKDAAGKPVAGAEVAIVVVDEAILALSGYAMGDPLAVFYPQRSTDTRDYHLRQHVALVDPAALRSPEEDNAPTGAARMKKKGGKQEMRMMKSAPMPSAQAAPAAPPEAKEMMAEAEMPADGFADIAGADQQSDQPIAVRSNFNPLATFASAEKTNASGVARVSYEMPDNLTRYRIMAVAVHQGEYYGTGESNVTARLPLMVRPSPPRFLNFGDQFDLAVVLQNQTDAPMDVAVASRGANIEFAKTTGWKVQVPANDRVEVRFPAHTDQAGTARFQVAATAGKWSDANEFSLPVWTPATSEAFATYGVIDEGSVVQPVAAPTEVWPQFGELEVTTSSTALQALTDAFIYLYEYEYQCAEQIASRMVSVAALRDVLSAFEAEGMPSTQDVARSMSRDIEELTSRQNYDGGFGLWRRGQPSWPYVSIHATHALARAKQKGYEVPQYSLDRARSYLQNIENYLPGWWPEWVRLHAIAYSLYVRNQMGDKDPGKARNVIQRGKKLENLSFESVGWLLATLTGQSGYEKDTAEIRRFLNNRVTETAAGAHFAAAHSDESDYVIMHSDRVADGVILEALIEDQPKSDLIPKIVNGLLAHRTKGRWGNTQENAFILLALDLYFNTFEGKTPDFVARVWLGDQYAGDHKFKGRTTESHQIDIPMKYLVNTGGKQKLYIQKDGQGRMYYRIGMNYAPKSLFLEPAEHGFTVERAYEPVDNDDDVKRLNDGTWEIKAGAKVKVKLTMLAPTRRYHVALVDPLPAGLESMNPALAVTGDVPQDEAANTGRGGGWGWWWWTRPWFEHQNMRDERTEAFTTLLWGGVHTYTYYARATTPGKFVVPPTKAEEMYHPETFGRSASDRVNVVD